MYGGSNMHTYIYIQVEVRKCYNFTQVTYKSVVLEEHEGARVSVINGPTSATF